VNRVDCEYDSFTHLRRALFWSVDQPVIALTFYADDAGKKEAGKYVVAGGYIGLVAQWERFCSDWRLSLASVGLPEFHASDFFTGNDIFVGWNSKERKADREKLLITLAEIIHDYSLMSFTCAVHTADWFEVNEDFMLEEMGFAPFSLAGRAVIERVQKWCGETRHDPSTVEYIFDQGSEDWGHLKIRSKDFDVEVIPRDRRKIRPLQAADWIAYEEFLEAPRSETVPRTHPFRRSYGALLKATPCDPLVVRKSDLLTKICTVPAMKIPRRSPQGKAATKLWWDHRKVDRVWRRHDRLGKKLQKLEDFGPAVDPRKADDPLIIKFQAEAEIANTMIETHGNLAKSLREAMTAGNPENQDKLLGQFTEEMRLQREWLETHISLMEKYYDLLVA
jgi:hypothetical protein